MKRILALVVALCLAPIGAQAWWQSVAQQSVGSAPSYQGPGDVVSGALAWGSCARVYTAAQASTATSLCDLVAVTGGAAVCTLRGSSTGFVDLAASYCAGTTPAAACAAASGGSCKVAKVYDQSGTGNDFTQATLGNMPALTFSALGGLPGMTFAAGSGVLATAGNIAQSQPFSFSSVATRTNTAAGAIISSLSAATYLGYQAVANQITLSAGSALNTTASDNAFHAYQGVANGASSSIVVDGSATTNTTATTATSGTLRIGRTNGAVTMTGTIMEAGFWPSGFNATQYGDMNTNQHSSANGYNF